LYNGREIHLVARPRGSPLPTDFAIVDVAIPELVEGQVLVRNTWMSVDPAIRLRMDGGASYLPPFPLGGVLDGFAVGVIIDSAVADLKLGDVVVHRSGWRSLALIDVSDHASFRRVDVGLGPPEAHLSVLGHTGFSAYTGLFRIAELRDRDVVFVSGAAGAVGSLAGQMAKLRGNRVIGSAGTDAKVTHLLSDLGFDAAFNYRDGPILEALRVAAPGGIDVYFDNVGGEHLDAAIDVLREHGRAALCGTVSTYNGAGPPGGLRDVFRIVAKRLRLQGFLIGDHLDLRATFEEEVGAWLRAGQLVQRTTVVSGLEHAPQALIGLLRGENLGKTLVRLP
jgi:NADPH-dependent curcumin reductase CurA